ncbi:MAG: hypothetical protein WC314_25625 [Vulcanimicrobiota bacterium]
MAITALHQNGSYRKYGGVRETSQMIGGREVSGIYGVILTEGEEVLFGPYESKRQAAAETASQIRAVAKWGKGYRLVNQ